MCIVVLWWNIPFWYSLSAWSSLFLSVLELSVVCESHSLTHIDFQSSYSLKRTYKKKHRHLICLWILETNNTNTHKHPYFNYIWFFWFNSPNSSFYWMKMSLSHMYVLMTFNRFFFCSIFSSIDLSSYLNRNDTFSVGFSCFLISILLLIRILFMFNMLFDDTQHDRDFMGTF